MVRVITQILIGLMLLFGALNLARRALFHFRSKKVLKALCFSLLFAAALFFSILAFYYAYSGVMEVWNKA